MEDERTSGYRKSYSTFGDLAAYKYTTQSEVLVRAEG